MLPAAPLPVPMDRCSALVGQAPGLLGPGEPLFVGVGDPVPLPAGPVGVGVGVTVTVLVTVGAAAGEPEGPQAVASSTVPASTGPASTALVIRCRGTRRDVTVTSFPGSGRSLSAAPLRRRRRRAGCSMPPASTGNSRGSPHLP